MIRGEKKSEIRIFLRRRPHTEQSVTILMALIGNYASGTYYSLIYIYISYLNLYKYCLVVLIYCFFFIISFLKMKNFDAHLDEKEKFLENGKQSGVRYVY